MKILWSFNTKLDEHELYDAIQKNWEWNAIMMKKHWVFLIQPMVRMILAFMAFWLLIWFAYRQFYNSEYAYIFWILTVAYSWVTLARCIHSLIMIIYDIKSQSSIREGYVDRIDTESFKEWKYEKFLKHSFISMWFQILLMITNSIVSFVVDTDATTSILLNIVGVIVNIWFLFLLYKVLDRIIDYEMDFNIFTVDQFIIFRQHWFLKTESLNVATSTIKIVQESSSWFWGSLFNFWKVSIHPEGDLWKGTKAIELFFVPLPKKLTKKLNEFIEKSKELTNIHITS